MKKVLIVLLSTALLWIAQVSAASACFVQWYEPEVPEAMR
ncbi:MAG TPA: cyclic lactone autoinducer peptide [Desulfotomaculum sp.]|nr:cyclic lactone autoinducer peptide [Desulfotomaculum sp.]